MRFGYFDFSENEIMGFKKTVVLSVALACAMMFLPTVASAGLITGSTTFGSLVANLAVPSSNSAVFVGIPSFVVVNAGTGTLASAQYSIGFAKNIMGNGPIVDFLNFGAFSVDVLNISGTGVWSFMTSTNGTVSASTAMNVVVSAFGFQSTLGQVSMTVLYAAGLNSIPQTWYGTLTSLNLPAPSAPTPEPGTTLLLSAGLIGIGLYALRFKKPSAEGTPTFQ